MKVADFRAGLADLEAAMRSWGGAKQANEFKALASALEEFDELSVPELAKRIRAINSSTSSSKTAKGLNNAAIERHFVALENASRSSDSFEMAVEAAIKDTREMKVADLVELSRRFGGSAPSKKTKAAIASYLKSRRLEMMRQEGLGHTIDKMYSNPAA